MYVLHDKTSSKSFLAFSINSLLGFLSELMVIPNAHLPMALRTNPSTYLKGKLSKSILVIRNVLMKIYTNYSYSEKGTF